MTTVPRPHPLARALFGRLRQELLLTLSGTTTGTPEWVELMALGDDEGYFGPESAVWHVNGANPTLIAGIRALLMQALHPGAMAGVAGHSRYNTDPLGRLAGTVRWVVVTTFGSTEIVHQEMQRVAKLHQRVSGRYQPNGREEEIDYSAADSDLIAWVHLVFTDSFLRCHQQLGDGIPSLHGETGADRYVREWSVAGDLMGYPDAPQTEAELARAIESFIPQLRRDEVVADTVRFITAPPLPPRVRPGYRLLVAAAIATLEPRYRAMLGLRRPWWPALTIGKAMVRFTGWVLGPESPSKAKARERVMAHRSTG